MYLVMILFHELNFFTPIYLLFVFVLGVIIQLLNVLIYES